MCNFTLLFEADFQIDGRFKIELKSNLPEKVFATCDCCFCIALESTLKTLQV